MVYLLSYTPGMTSATIQVSDIPTRAELIDLYDAVGWTVYTKVPDQLEAAVRNSAFIVTARSDGQLIGLARCLSDDTSIAFLQDILVRPEHQGKGVGHLLIDACFERYAHVRTFALLTDDRPEQLVFYEKHGLENVAATSKPALNAFVRMTPASEG